MQTWRPYRHVPASPLRGNRKPFNTIMSAMGNNQTKLNKFTLQDAGPSPPPQEGRIILYAHCLCPYAERAWLALLEKNVPFHLVHIDLSSKPSWFRSINPRGLVPAVVDTDGTVHVESLDICRWVDTLESDVSNNTTPSEDIDSTNGGTVSLKFASLSPSDAAGKARMNEIISAGSALSEAGLSFLSGRNGRYWGISSGQTAQQRKEFESALRKAIVDPIIESNGSPFLMGKQITIADIAVYPFVKRYQVACREFCNGFDVSSTLNGVVGQWLDAMGQRPACQITTAVDELLVAAYRKHSSLDFFDYDSYLVTDLHPQNEQYRI